MARCRSCTHCWCSVAFLAAVLAFAGVAAQLAQQLAQQLGLQLPVHVVSAAGRAKPAPLLEGSRGLWVYLRSSVLPHLQRLGPTAIVVASKAEGAESQSLQRDFAHEALPVGAEVAPSISMAKSVVFLFNDCGQVLQLGSCRDFVSQSHINSKEVATVLAVRVCSSAEYDEAYRLLYNVNCDVIWGNHKCPHPKLHGKELSCKDFFFANLHRVGFVPGYFVLELRSESRIMNRLAEGDFLSHALALKPVTTDKVTKHSYHELYERYLPAKRALPNGTMLEIGLGCNMNYGPGKSAELWRKYLPNLRIEMMDNDAGCTQKWSKSIQALNISVHVGAQGVISKDVAKLMRGGPGYVLVIDDGSHFNSDIKHSFEHLWPVIAPGGYYVMEDMGEPAFTFYDCEPLESLDQRQYTTALAKIAEVARPLVLMVGKTDVAQIECLLEICLLQKL